MFTDQRVEPQDEEVNEDVEEAFNSDVLCAGVLGFTWTDVRDTMGKTRFSFIDLE